MGALLIVLAGSGEELLNEKVDCIVGVLVIFCEFVGIVCNGGACDGVFTWC